MKEGKAYRVEKQGKEMRGKGEGHEGKEKQSGGVWSEETYWKREKWLQYDRMWKECGGKRFGRAKMSRNGWEQNVDEDCDEKRLAQRRETERKRKENITATGEE